MFKVVTQSTIESVTKEEFESILYAVDNHDPIHILGGKEKGKICINHIWGFRLFY
jgi:hypothetical protein